MLNHRLCSGLEEVFAVRNLADCRLLLRVRSFKGVCVVSRNQHSVDHVPVSLVYLGKLGRVSLREFLQGLRSLPRVYVYAEILAIVLGEGDLDRCKKEFAILADVQVLEGWSSRHRLIREGMNVVLVVGNPLYGDRCAAHIISSLDHQSL